MEEINATLIESIKAIEPAETLDQSLVKILKAQAEEKLRYKQSLIKYFQRRYGMTAKEFYETRIKDKKHSWEDEDTYFDWVTAQREIQEMEAEIRKLEDLLYHADR
jgi:hypothetical protein